MMSKADWLAFFDQLEQDYPGPALALQREQLTKRQLGVDHLQGLVESGRVTKAEVIAQLDKRINPDGAGAIIIE